MGLLTEGVMISMERLAELEAADAKLAALEAAGVDNWAGYPEAMALLEQEDEGPSDAEIDAVSSIKVVADAEDEDSEEDDADEQGTE